MVVVAKIISVVVEARVKATGLALEVSQDLAKVVVRIGGKMLARLLRPLRG